MTGLALIVALAMATVGLRAYVRAGQLETRISALQAQVAGLQRRVATDENAAAADRRHVRSVAAQANGARGALSRLNWALQSVPSQAQLAAVRNEVAGHGACIAELHGAIAGLAITWKIDGTKPASDYFRLTTSAPVSASCGGAPRARAAGAP